MTGLLPALSGATAIYGAGMLELGMAMSMEQLVIDNDIIRMIKKAEEGILVNDETLGVKAIQKVGAGGNFLGHKSTLKNVQLPSDPQILDRMMMGDWEAAGSKDLVTVAHERVVDIHENHEVEAIDADILKDLEAIVAEADKAYK